MKVAELLNHTAVHREPFFAFRPRSLQASVEFFKKHFNGTIFYAIKTNPETHVLKQLHQLGIDSFELASISEIVLVKSLFPNANCYFMHPVKPRLAIRDAYFMYGVRDFAIDSEAELNKILEETQNAKDLSLHVRISIPNTYAEHSLADKFGINMINAPVLLKTARAVAAKLGICFHVGSQCMHPDAYRIAIRMTRDLIRPLRFNIDSLNVGGGFPSIYPGLIPPPLDQYFKAIREEFAIFNRNRNIQLFSEPGRALVAESTSLIVQVLLRKGDALYINDGIYGALFDAGFPKLIYPVQLITTDVLEPNNLTAYRFYGPTCDSLDQMHGPFYLPNNVKEGDFIEIGQLGAYGRTLATGFNGFSHHPEVCVVEDEPLMTLYGTTDAISKEPLEVIAA